MKDLECNNKIEYLLKKSYYVIDFLPEQVPRYSKGQFFKVEKFYLSKGKLKELRFEFIGLFLKHDFSTIIRSTSSISKSPST